MALLRVYMRFVKSVRARRLLVAALAVSLFPAAAHADLWWDTTTSGGWATPGNWSLTAAGAADPTAVPTASDIVTFNNTSITQTAANTISLNGDQSVKGFVTNASSTFITVIDGGSSNSVLNLGTSGINSPGSTVGFTIGSTTEGKKVTVNLAGTQSWTSSGTTQALFVLNDVTLGTSTPSTLSLLGSNSGAKIDGVISDGTLGGKLSVTRNGSSGTWTLNGLNTYTGVTTVTTGTLTITKLANGGLASSIGASTNAASNLVFGGGGSLTINGTGGSTDRAFTMTGTSMALISGTSAPAIFTNTAALNFGGTAAARSFVLRGASTQNNSFAGLIADNDATNKTSLSKSEVGKWIIANNANTYTGVTNVVAGTLGVSVLANGGTASSIGASPDAAANLLLGDATNSLAGILQYTGAGNSSSRNFTINFNGSGFDASGTGALTLTSTAAPAWGTTNQARTLLLTGSNTGDNSLASLLSTNGTAAIGLTKSGAGKWILANNANSYTGITTINAGTLAVNVLDNGGANSSIGASPDAATNLVLGGGTLQYLGSGNTSSRSFTVSASSSLDASGTGALVLSNTASPAWGTTNQVRTLTLTGSSILDNTLAASLTNNGTTTNAVSLSKTGTGKWILTGTSTNTGGATISDGTLVMGSAQALSTGAVTVTNGILEVGAGIAGSAGTIQLNGTGSINTAAGGTLATTGTFDLRSGTINGVLTGSSAINKTTAGTVTINSSLTTSGLITVSAGSLAMGASVTLGTSALTVTGGNFDLGANHAVTTGTVTLNGAAATLAGSGTSTLTTTGTFELQNGIVNANLTGSSAINKTTASNVTLNAANSFTSVVTISAGTLIANHAQALGSTSAKTNIVTGASLAVGDGITAGAGETVELIGPGVSNNGGLTALAGTAGTWAGTTELTGTSPRIGAWLNGTMTVTGPIVDGTSLTGQSLFINGALGAGTPGTIIIAAPAGQNTFTAPSWIARGTLKLGADNTLPTGNTVDVHYSTTNPTDVATFDLNGFNQMLGGLNNGGGSGSSATSVVTNSSAALKTLTINNASTGTYSGTITGNLGFTKSGSANYTLSSVNTFTGPTRVSNGTLTVTGTNPIGSSSLIQVDAGATLNATGVTGGLTLGTAQTLAGTGTVSGNVTLAAGANLSPGASPGTLTFTGNLDLSATGGSNSGDLFFELGTASDLASLTTGTLTIGSSLGFNDFTFTGGPGLAPGSYTLFDSSVVIAGTLDSADLTGSFGAGFSGTLGLADNGNDIVLTVAAIPEPSTLVLAGLGALGFAGLRLRRRRMQA
jgi:fibronectin-binding autotransporter adhesin